MLQTLVLTAELRCLLWNEALARMHPWAINTHSHYIVQFVCLGYKGSLLLSFRSPNLFIESCDVKMLVFLGTAKHQRQKAICIFPKERGNAFRVSVYQRATIVPILYTRK
jgi:hypothetical protein